MQGLNLQGPCVARWIFNQQTTRVPTLVLTTKFWVICYTTKDNLHIQPVNYFVLNLARVAFSCLYPYRVVVWDECATFRKGLIKIWLTEGLNERWLLYVK